MITEKDDVQWGNLSLGDLTHEDLMRTDVNKIVANRKKAKDPVFLEKVQLASDKKWADPVYAEKHKDMLQRTKQTELWRNNHAAAMQELTSTEEYKTMMTEVNRETAKRDDWKAKQAVVAQSEYRKQRLAECTTGDKHWRFKGVYVATNNTNKYNERFNLAPGQSRILMPKDLKTYRANSSHVSKACKGTLPHYLGCNWSRRSD